jgi:hypothetical protein
MKSPLVLLLILPLAGGCAALNNYQTIHPEPDFSDVAPRTAPLTPMLSVPAPAQDGAVQLFQPVRGGAPTMGIPLGGNLFQPVTGGPPVIGIPTGL